MVSSIDSRKFKSLSEFEFKILNDRSYYYKTNEDHKDEKPRGTNELMMYRFEEKVFGKIKQENLTIWFQLMRKISQN